MSTDPSSIASTRALLPFEISGHLLALEANLVLEVTGPHDWVPIPQASDSVPGALAWRGRALAVADLGPVLSLPAIVAPKTRARNLIIRLSDDTIVLTVDRVREARSSEELAPVHAADLGLPAFGELEIDGRLALVLDLERWVQSLRRKQ